MNQAYGQAAGQMIGGYGVAQTASSYSQDAPARQLEVPAGVNRLENGVSALSIVLDQLDNRLSGYVARSCPPMKEAGTQLKGALSTGLGQQLDNITAQIENLSRRATDLMERLEA